MNLLAAQPGLGRTRDTTPRKIISALSTLGILFGTVESAGLPALYAATSPDARNGGLYGPYGPGHLGGAPAEQKLYSRFRHENDAEHIWQVSEELTGMSLPG